MPYNSSYTGYDIDRAIGEVRKRSKAWDNKQAKVIGQPGQVAGFDQRGNLSPMDFDGFNLSDYVKGRSVSVTLSAAAWTENAQTVYVEGISVDEGAQLIQPVPASASFSAYADAEIHVEQSLNQLTFTCKEVPLVDLSVFIVIQELKGATQ